VKRAPAPFIVRVTAERSGRAPQGKRELRREPRVDTIGSQVEEVDAFLRQGRLGRCGKGENGRKLERNKERPFLGWFSGEGLSSPIRLCD